MSFSYKFLTGGNDSYYQDWNSPSRWIVARGGNDTVSSYSANADTVDGGSGNDDLTGNGRDVLIGGTGDDKLHLWYLPGDPSIGGRVIELAGGGTDTLELLVRYSGTFDLPANVENLELSALEYGDYYDPTFRLRGNELGNRIDGSRHNDTIEGRAGNDILNGYGGADALYGEEGNDVLYGGNNADYMSGGAGNDTLNGVSLEDAAFADTMLGGTGNDHYSIGWNDVVIENAGEGWDTVETQIASYSLTAHVEELLFTGTGGASYGGNDQGNLIHAKYAATGQLLFWGGEGADTLRGASAGDVLRGDGGNDLVEGNGGHDLILGGDGLDVLRGGTGNDTMDGGNDSDTLEGGAGRDSLLGGAGHDRMLGGTELDILRGGSGGDTLFGEDGDDRLFGDGGNDSIQGGAGNDLIIGGTGRDTMIGDAGFDQFIFTRTTDSMAVAADRIIGFDAAEDLISLVAIDADGSYGTKDKFTYVGDAPVVGIKGALWITGGSGYNSVFGDVNGDGLAEMRIEVFSSGGFSEANILL